MAATQFLIERLNSTNYDIWSEDIKHVLIELNCWSIVEGSETEPDKEKVIERKSYLARERKALATIYFSIEEDLRIIIRCCDSSTEAWKKIKSHYLPETRAFHARLFYEFCDCKLEDSENIDFYAARLLRISNKMKAINKPIREIYLSYQILRFLPAHFDGIVHDILRWPDERFNFKDIVKALIAEETALELWYGENSVTRAHATQMYRGLPRRKFFCYECGEKGHSKSQCRHKLEDASPRYYEGKDTATDSATDTSPIRYRNRARGRSTNNRRRPPLRNSRQDCSD